MLINNPPSVSSRFLKRSVIDDMSLTLLTIPLKRDTRILKTGFRQKDVEDGKVGNNEETRRRGMENMEG